MTSQWIRTFVNHIIYRIPLSGLVEDVAQRTKNHRPAGSSPVALDKTIITFWTLCNEEGSARSPEAGLDYDWPLLLPKSSKWFEDLSVFSIP